MYSMNGLATAIGEITLVIFTTLTPSGVMAYILMALPSIFHVKHLDEAAFERIEKFLSIPIAVSMVGLVASATHLGDPSNALYVITGVGRSPLSNEVASGVAFLGCAGVFWLTAFSERKKHPYLRRAILAVISVLGLLFIGTISFAYSADTIMTWNTAFTPLSIWLNALMGGPLLALLGLRVARVSFPHHRLGFIYLCVSTASWIVNTVLYIVWGALLPMIGNAMTTAAALSPLFGVMAILFALLCAIGILLSAKAVFKEDEAPRWMLIGGCSLVFAGIFVMRFCFYMIHMTVGLGV